MKRFFSPSRLGPRELLLLAVAACSGCSISAHKNGDLCTPDDADGVISEPTPLLLTVTDSEFSPKILTAQNVSEITLTFKNEGTTPHSFVVACKSTPNSDGCPTQSCFPSDSKIEPVAPGQSARVVFETPLVEGLYDFHSDVPEDSALTPGQFNVQ